jgi:hypothetical protein
MRRARAAAQAEAAALRAEMEAAQQAAEHGAATSLQSMAYEDDEACLITLTLDRDFAEIAEPASDARAEFEKAFVADVARALELPTSRVVIGAVRGGSVIVDFFPLPEARSSLMNRSDVMI